MNLYVPRVNIYIDGSNLYHGLKQNGYAPQLDFRKFLEILTGSQRRLGRAYYYNAPMRQDDGEDRWKAQQRFFEALQKVDYLTVCLGRLEQRGNSMIEKGLDVRISVDMLTHAFNNHYDEAILVSGDGDFVYILEAVKNLGRRVENVYFERGRSRQLAQVADRFVELTPELLEPCLFGQNSGNRGTRNGGRETERWENEDPAFDGNITPVSE